MISGLFQLHPVYLYIYIYIYIYIFFSLTISQAHTFPRKKQQD